MKTYEQLARSVKFTNHGTKIEILEKDSNLEYVGSGRSAFVFKIKSTNKVIKIFFSPFEYIAKEEAEIYNILAGIQYFPRLYEEGYNYLVIDYIKGNTLFECINKGISVTSQKIAEVDVALNLARERGLNPSDIHLRNIIITSQDEIKIIDVARFRQEKDCSQWDDLKLAYNKFYNTSIFPKKLPTFMLNFIALLYKKQFLTVLTKHYNKKAS